MKNIFREAKKYGSLREAWQDIEFSNRLEAGPVFNRLYETSEHIFDRKNKLKYFKRMEKRKPAAMTNGELYLVWALMDKDLIIKHLKKESGK